MKKYCWRAKKRKAKFHLQNDDTGKTFCQIENSSAWKNVTAFSDEKPKGRNLCDNCRGLSEPQKFTEPLVGPVTRELIERLKTKNGGWTKSTLKLLGVPWPPPKGWKNKLLQGQESDYPEPRLAILMGERVV